MMSPIKWATKAIGCALLAAVVVGCGDNSMKDGTGQAEVSGGELNAQSSTGLRDSVPDDWDLSADALEKHYESYLASLQDLFPINEPVEPQLIRWVSIEEWAPTQVECLREKGIPASIGVAGGIELGDVPKEQGPAQIQAGVECYAQYPVDPRYNQVLPLKRAEAQYNFYVDELRPCVEAEGYSVSDPPSLQAWLDDYYDDQFAWNPFDEAAQQTGVDSDAFGHLYEVCSPYSLDVFPPAEFD